MSNSFYSLNEQNRKSNVGRCKHLSLICCGQIIIDRKLKHNRIKRVKVSGEKHKPQTQIWGPDGDCRPPLFILILAEKTPVSDAQFIFFFYILLFGK